MTFDEWKELDGNLAYINDTVDASIIWDAATAAQIEQFADTLQDVVNLAVAAERETCAKICEAGLDEAPKTRAQKIEKSVAIGCAIAIRNRGTK